jgi:hypothetical protein
MPPRASFDRPSVRPSENVRVTTMPVRQPQGRVESLQAAAALAPPRSGLAARRSLARARLRLGPRSTKPGLALAKPTEGCHADGSDGRTNDRTMAAGASVTCTHSSVLFEVTWGKTKRVRADATMRPRGRTRVRANASPSAPLSLPTLPSPPLPSPPSLPSPPLPSPLSLPPL